MNARRLACAVIILAIGVALGRTAGSAAGDDDKNQKESLAAQCAQAQLKLAEMNLQWAQEMNKKVPGTLIGGMMMQFAEEVEMTKAKLQTAKASMVGDPYQAAIERMKLALRSAEARAKTALQTYERAPTIVTKNDVERTRQAAVVADLQLQHGLTLADAPPHDKLQWQLEVIGHDLDQVRLYTYLLGQNRLGQFSPGGF
jgi:hypothetical protein